MGGVGLSLVGFFLVVRSFKISKALTFAISTPWGLAREVSNEAVVSWM